MKNLKNVLLLIVGAAICFLLGAFLVKAFQSNPAVGLGLIFLIGSLIPKGSASTLYVNTPDLSALTTAFGQWGGRVLRQHVNTMDLGMGVTMYKGVGVPALMPKISATGNPQPYAAADNVNPAAKFTNRTLNVYQSKWDFDIDPEIYRNTFLNSKSGAPFYQVILDQVGASYMAAINNSVLFNGIYNPVGNTAADIATGWNQILKAEAAKATPGIIAKVIGAINGTNAVTKVEAFASAQPVWWRKQGFVIKCSYATFDAYKTNYRTINAFGFQPREDGMYYLDGFSNVMLHPVSWIPNDGLLGVVFDALAFGTDGDRIQVAASLRRNIIELRLMMPVGLEIQDMECVSVSDNLIA